MSNPKKFLLLNCCLLTKDRPEPEDWEKMSKHLCTLQRSLYWWIGDYFRFGEAQLGDEIYQYIDETFSTGLIERCLKVSREYPVDERFETLSWTHHYVAMTLSNPLRKAVLGLAEKNRWDTAQLRQYITKLKG